jgi:hypothetical protein
LQDWLRRIVIGLLVLVAVAGVGMVAVYRATQWVPPFYEQRLGLDSTELAQAGDQLEQQLQAIQETHEDETVWNTILTEDQVNGWLAVNLKKKFPRLLPYSVRNPRVAFTPDDALIACQYASKTMSAVISLNVNARATERKNVVAVTLTNAKLGAVPGLLDMAIEEINQAAKRAKIDLEWAEEDGADVAYITIPEHLIDDQHRFELHDVEIANGELRIAGQLVPVIPEQ